VPFLPLAPRWVKNQDLDPESGSRVNIPDHISESLKTIFWVKYLNSFMQMQIQDSGTFLILDPGWKNADQGSGIN
jgi:hypothetical protein